MSSLSDTFILDNLHRIRNAICERVSSFDNVSRFNSHCTDFRRIYCSCPNSYIESALWSLTNGIHSAVYLRKNCSAGKSRRSQKHSGDGVETGWLIRSLRILVFTSHTAAVLRVADNLAFSKLEKMSIVVDFNIYSLAVPYILLRYDLSSGFFISVRQSNPALLSRSANRQDLWQFCIVHIKQHFMLKRGQKNFLLSSLSHSNGSIYRLHSIVENKINLCWCRFS